MNNRIILDEGLDVINKINKFLSYLDLFLEILLDDNILGLKYRRDVQDLLYKISVLNLNIKSKKENFVYEIPEVELISSKEPLLLIYDLSLTLENITEEGKIKMINSSDFVDKFIKQFEKILDDEEISTHNIKLGNIGDLVNKIKEKIDLQLF